MFNTNDNVLVNYRPNSLPDKDFKEDLEEIITNGAYHSDEISETDNEKADQENKQNVRPKNKDSSDKHVLHVYDKPWRSRRVSKIMLFILLALFSHILYYLYYRSKKFFVELIP